MYPIALWLVVNELSDVLFAIFPGERSLTVHAVIVKVAFIYPSIWPYEFAFSFNVVQVKGTTVDVLVGER